MIFSIGLIGCEKSESNLSMEEPIQVRNENNESGKLLAYEHGVTVDLPSDQVLINYNSTLKKCQQSKNYDCDITRAAYSSEKYGRSVITFRVESKGVDHLINHAKQGGEITAQSTSIDDLTKPVMDIEKRIEMLTDYRDKLLEIQIKAADDVDSLVRIAEELSTVQSNIERAKNSANRLTLRVERDLLTIRFNHDTSQSVWQSLGQTFKDLPESFTMGLADTLDEVMYLIPWLIVVIILFILFRWLWHKTQPKQR